ncbi:MAG: hypothetical protein L0Y43_02895 [Methylococcaceae bacterium]|nr:hypothetical protein [Methylococcaceae bacterium]
MDRITEIVGLFFAAVMVTAVGFEISRRRKKLHEIYDVLDSETKHIAIELEQMVEDGTLKPFTEDSLA